MDIISDLQNKNNSIAYKLLLQLEIESTESNQYYKYFDDFIELLKSKSSFVRVRGFRLACAQAPWDSENKLVTNIDLLLHMLDDERPTAIRQCLTALHLIVLYKPNLSEKIRSKLDKMNLSKYKDSMISLLEKDIEELYKALNE